MTDMIPLTERKIGERAVICALLSDPAMKRRLEDLGFVEGTELLCALRSPLGTPVAYRIRGSLIALRPADASSILTADCPPPLSCHDPQ